MSRISMWPQLSQSLTNTSDTTMRILNDPSSILSSKFATHTFDVSSDSGSPAFTGVKVKYDPDYVVKKNADSSFTVLTPGESVTVNFTGSGTASYSIEPSSLFYYVDPDTSELASINADTQQHTAKISGTLAVARRSNLGKRISYNGCTSSRQTTLVSAAAAAQIYAQCSYDYLSSHTASTTRYVTAYAYGQSECKALASKNPDQAVKNTEALNILQRTSLILESDYTCVLKGLVGTIFPLVVGGKFGQVTMVIAHHLVVENFRFVGCRRGDQMLVKDVKDILADLGQFAFNLLPIALDHGYYLSLVAFLDSSFCSIEETIRQEALRAPITFL
ncbi:hypothetical protein EDD18DRAFT_1327561 [Armillaria luteobubalina]|uniref:Deuterolysin n=1 Tax=Armillaria luteobubalina TaxID=153913 RepID=A0AA39QHT2_9AGAR|nr:hypothetical protein EDD18DRAFT_1327561 [Armillaria luteobubalina]